MQNALRRTTTPHTTRNRLVSSVSWLIIFIASYVFAISAAWAAKLPGQSTTQLADGLQLILGGEKDGKAQAQAVLLNASGEAQALRGQPHYARTQHSATMLADGRVLIAGGVDADGKPVGELEVYSPQERRFEVLAKNLLTSRSGHTASVLSNGQVLIAGGFDAQGKPVREAELWTFTAKPNTESISWATARAEHSATLLVDGRILFSSGYEAPASTTANNKSDRKKASAAIYDPNTQRFTNISDAAAQALLTNPPQAQVLPTFNETTHAIALGGPIAIRFSQAMDYATLNTRSITLLGPTGSVNIKIVLAENGRIAFVTPTQDLLPASRYTLFVNKARVSQGDILPLVAYGFDTPVLTAATDARVQIGTSLSATISVTNASTTANKRDRNGARIAEPNGENNKSDAFKFSASDSDDNERWLPSSANRGGRWRTGRMLPEEIQQHMHAALAIHARLAHQRGTGYTKLRKADSSVSSATAAGSQQVSGIVLRQNDRPLANVALMLAGQRTRTDGAGRFSFNGVAAGRQELIVDGRPAGDGANYEYGRFVIGIDVTTDKPTAIEPIYLPKILKSDWIDLPSPVPEDTIVRTPLVPGMEIHIPKGTVLRDRDGKIVTRIALSPMPLDRSPFPFPENAPVYVSVQPGGMTVQGLTPGRTAGIRVIYPNQTDLAPGSRVNFWRYTAAEGWGIYGDGIVESTGKQVIPDAGVALYESVGFMYTDTNPAPPKDAPPCDDDCKKGGGVGSGGPAKAADPVDLWSGLFLHQTEHAYLPDTLPIDIRATYRPGDTVVRSFGYGHSHEYAMYLREVSGTPTRYQQYDLILANGSAIRYVRTSAGSDYTTVVAEHTASPSSYFKSVLAYDNGNYVVTKKDGTKFVFSLYGQLSSIKNRVGQSLEFARSAGGIARITSSSGRYVDFFYDTSNRIKQIKDIGGRTWTYAYNTAGYLQQITFPDTKTESYTYDAAGNMKTVTDRRANVMMTNEYDANGRVKKQTLADGAVYLFAYTVNATTGKVDQTDVTYPDNTIRRVKFHATGYPSSDTYGQGLAQSQTWTYTRDASGLLRESLDPLNRKTKYEPDSKGNILTITHAADTAEAITETYTYTSDFNQVATYKNGLGKIWTYSYDALGQLYEIKDPLTRLTKFTYTPQGQIKTVTDARSKVTTFTYDLSDLQSITDSMGRITRFYTDNLGRRTATLDALGRLWRSEYNDVDRIVKTTDPMNAVVDYEYDGNGNLTFIKGSNSTGPTVTQYTYDLRNRRIKTTDPLTRVSSASWDGQDRLKTTTDRNSKTTTLNYDPLGRLKQTDYADDTKTIFTYDLANQRLSAQELASGTSTPWQRLDYDYDLNGRAKYEKSTRNGTLTSQITYAYDNAHRRTQHQMSGQTAVDYTWDDANRLKQLTQGTQIVKIDYDDADRRSLLTLANGITLTYTWDDANQLTKMDFKNGTAVVGNLAYGYNKNRQRTAIDGTLNPYQLPATASGTYDKGNQMLTFDGSSEGHDLEGNRTYRNGWYYTWDVRGRLKEIKNSSSAVLASFEYDAANRRIGKTIGGVTTRFAYDGLNVIQEQNSSNTPIANLLTGGIDEYFVRSETGGTVRHYLTDALGSTVALTDAAGAIKTSYKYDPYGKTQVTGEVSTNTYQYTGRENDGNGLYFYRARYYDPATKRFISRDPLRQGMGINEYEFVLSDPLNYVDPTGKFAMVLPALPALGNWLAGLATAGFGAWLWDKFGPMLAEESPPGSDEPVYPENPDSAKDNFKPVPNGPAKECKNDGSIWERDRSSHGGEQWKRWPDKKSWEKGRKPQSIWPDGRIRK